MTTFEQQVLLLTDRSVTLEKLWQLAHFQPNDAQREAILHVEGPLYLTAGPGSGKTRVLLWRTVNLIVFHDVAPGEIFLSTFTEKAALQLREGLQSLLGLVTNLNGKPYDLSQMYIGTVHSLCQRLLSDRRRFSAGRQRNRPPTLLDELDQYFHLSKARTWATVTAAAGLGVDPNAAVNAAFGSPSQSKHVAVTHCIAIFNRFSEECLDPAVALERLANDDGQLRAYFQQWKRDPTQVALLLRLYMAYRDSLTTEEGALTDFSLLQQEAYRALMAFPDAGKAFRHVIVDEYQDTNTIQERIFFKLASGTGNLCVVGDDDQALYRFRGATVENFVEFPTRCQAYLSLTPRRISLATTYRSRKHIVDFYTAFMKQTNWAKGDGQPGFYRVMDKDIQPYQCDPLPAVVASTPAEPTAVCAEIATLVRALLDAGKVEDPNQIAFLFPSLKYQGEMTQPVSRMKAALEAVGLKVYAPRAGRFLDVEEACDVFGIFVQIFGCPSRADLPGHDYSAYHDWLARVEANGKQLMQADPRLEQFVKDRRGELVRAAQDYHALMEVAEQHRWDLDAPYQLQMMKRVLHNAPRLSERGKQLLASKFLDQAVERRAAQGQPVTLRYVVRRVTSLDWSLLDLFYQLCGFEHFKQMFDQAETGHDEGPVSNLGLITQYLTRFMDQQAPILTAELFVDGLFNRIFFASYLFALYRRGETEIEDAEDPFPKGRIPFLTIHQAKGLEFPVVVLGNPRKDAREPADAEVLVRPFLEREPGEPLERMGELDAMRMFYVALSRARNLLVLAHYQGRGQHMNEPFKALLDANFPRIPALDPATIPPAQLQEAPLPKIYSFTADYLMYQRCPRQYMIFRKYGFAPARSETMFFGSLVHSTLEDLHHELIRRREGRERTTSDRSGYEERG